MHQHHPSNPHPSTDKRAGKLHDAHRRAPMHTYTQAQTDRRTHRLTDDTHMHARTHTHNKHTHAQQTHTKSYLIPKQMNCNFLN